MEWSWCNVLGGSLLGRDMVCIGRFCVEVGVNGGVIQGDCGVKERELSMIVSIPKDSEKSVPTKYRPISLLPIASKILEHHIHSKIMLHLQALYPISDKQWGFCAKKSTVHALLSAMDDWLKSLETGATLEPFFFSTTLRPLKQCLIGHCWKNLHVLALTSTRLNG